MTTFVPTWSLTSVQLQALRRAPIIRAYTYCLPTGYCG